MFLKSHVRLFALLGLGATSLGTFSSGALALQLEEVVVTAQKRQQGAQDVPIAIAAFSGERLESFEINNSNEIAAKVPNVNIQSPGGEGGVTIIFIRGVGLNDFATNNTGPIGVYVDEVYAGTSNSQFSLMYDLDRVEVLKGPQGTLYGRNTTGGAISIFSNRPTDEFEGYIRGSYGNYSVGKDEKKVEGAFSGPLSDSVQGRVAFVKYLSDGFQKNLTTGDYVEKNLYSWRSQLAWNPADDLDILLNVHSSRNDSDNDLYSNSVTDDNFYKSFSNLSPELKVDEDGGSVKVDYRLSDTLDLVSISAYDELDKSQEDDADISNLTAVHVFFDVKADTYSQELRLLGQTDSAHWILGAFYWNNQLTQDQSINLTDSGLPVPYVYHNEQDTETWAVFGQTDYSLSETLAVTAGLRYTELEVDFDGNGTGLFFIDASTDPFTLLPGEYSLSDDVDDSNVSGKLGLNWFVREDVMAYGSVSKGFKGAGVNGNFIVDPLAGQDYASEDLWAYELGLKSTLLDGVLQFNIAAFYYDYSDAQVFNNAPVPALGLPANIIRNADVTQYGGEMDLAWTPIEGLFVQLGLGYTDASYDEDIDDPVTGVLEIKDNQVQNTPEYSAFGLINYEWALGGAGFLSAQLDATYSDDVYYNTFEDIAVGQEAYTITNAALSYSDSKDTVKVSLWGKNLSDKEYAAYAFDLRQDFGFLQLIRGVPRTLGVSVRYNF